MKKTSYHTFALLATAPLWFTQAFAQEEEGRPPHGHRPPAPLVGILDADHDHVISAEEIAASSKNLLTLDADGDGALSIDEIRPKPPKDAIDNDEADRPAPPPPAEAGPEGKGPRPPHSPLLAALDTDADGGLSAEEIAAAPASLAALDQDGDGSLQPEEFSPHPPRPGAEEGEAGQEGPPRGGPRGPHHGPRPR